MIGGCWIINGDFIDMTDSTDSLSQLVITIESVTDSIGL
jgi:hypothetical protein